MPYASDELALVLPVKHPLARLPELTKDDLDISSPYNTRKYPGLPPGPICNPSEDAIRAAANPLPSKYLYYVSRNDGTDLHYFANTEAEHIAYIKKAAANGGG